MNCTCIGTKHCANQWRIRVAHPCIYLLGTELGGGGGGYTLRITYTCIPMYICMLINFEKVPYHVNPLIFQMPEQKLIAIYIFYLTLCPFYLYCLLITCSQILPCLSIFNKKLMYRTTYMPHCSSQVNSEPIISHKCR